MSAVVEKKTKIHSTPATATNTIAKYEHAFSVLPQKKKKTKNYIHFPLEPEIAKRMNERVHGEDNI